METRKHAKRHTSMRFAAMRGVQEEQAGCSMVGQEVAQNGTRQ